MNDGVVIRRPSSRRDGDAEDGGGVDDACDGVHDLARGARGVVDGTRGRARAIRPPRDSSTLERTTSQKRGEGR